MTYSLQNGDENVRRVNAIGCGFSVIYLTVLFVYAGKRLKEITTLVLAAGGVGAALWAGISFGVADKDTRISSLGGVAVACNVIMYASPLAAIRQALVDMDPRPIPFLLTVASTFLSATWLIYGLLVNNWFIAGPNVAGAALCVAQLAVAMYVKIRIALDPSLAKQKLEDESEDGEGGGHDDLDEEGARRREGKQGLLINEGV